MRTQEHTLNSNRHVSPHVLSTDCCGESTNAAATLPSRSLAFRCGELVTSQNNSKDIMFTGKNLGKKMNKNGSGLSFFLAMTVTGPPPQDLLRGSFGQLAHVIFGGSPFK